MSQTNLPTGARCCFFNNSRMEVLKQLDFSLKTDLLCVCVCLTWWSNDVGWFHFNLKHSACDASPHCFAHCDSSARICSHGEGSSETGKQCLSHAELVICVHFCKSNNPNSSHFFAWDKLASTVDFPRFC